MPAADPSTAPSTAATPSGGFDFQQFLQTLGSQQTQSQGNTYIPFGDLGIDPGLGLTSTDKIRTGQMQANPAYAAWQKSLSRIRGHIVSDERSNWDPNVNLDKAQASLMHQEPEQQIEQDPQSVDSLLRGLIKANDKTIESYQDRLEKAGLIDAKKVQRGFSGDQDTLDSMIYVYWYAKQRGITVDAALAEMGKHPMPSKDSAGGGRESAAEMGANEYKAQLVAEYMRIWGVPPPGGYIERVMASHMNIFEFSANEKNKPAYEHSPGFNYDRLSLQHQIAQTLGSLG